MPRLRGIAAQPVDRRDAGAGQQFAAQQPAVVDRQRYLPGAGHERPAAFRATLPAGGKGDHQAAVRSEEHTSELQSLMRISYAVFCLKKKKRTKIQEIYA